MPEVAVTLCLNLTPHTHTPQTNRLQDPQEREYINNDKYFQQIFEVPRMKFTEIPHRLQSLLSSPDPIIIHHLIKSVLLLWCRGVPLSYWSLFSADAPDRKRTACYDIEVDVVRRGISTVIGVLMAFSVYFPGQYAEDPAAFFSDVFFQSARCHHFRHQGILTL